MSIETKFVDVILPLPIPNLYTYRVIRELNDAVAVGKRVLVQFGKSKLYSAVISKVHDTAPQHYQAKYIESVLDEQPIVTVTQLKLWEWMSRYYMCTIGEVMNAALPGGLKISSETRLILNPAFDGDFSQLTDNEFSVAEALETTQSLSVNDVTALLNRKSVYDLVRALLEKNVALVEEEVNDRYKPKLVPYVRLTEPASEETALRGHFDALEKAPKQLEMLMAYVQLSRMYSDNPQNVRKSVLQHMANATASVTAQLVKKEIFEIYDKQEGRLGSYDGDGKLKLSLSEEQTVAYDSITHQLTEKQVVLLHGVTSSGKTEVYIQLMRDTIARGKKVLYLLPEIALTTQIITRLQRYFGDRVGVYHSRFSQNERVEVWNNTISGSLKSYDVLLGARSALFLPIQDVGLIIVDEEHESSFKQYEPAPRYNARDTSIVLASLHGAGVLLGSATPSVETFFNAKKGKYGFAELTKRYGGIQLPEIFVADVKEASRRKEMHSHFSPMLIQAMEKALEQKEQVILFQNRRGFSPYIMCETCGWTPECKRCDVGMIYHKYFNSLRCHYCGYELAMPKTCYACGSNRLQQKGFGTEKIEEELSVYFPKARIGRMDLDTTRTKNAYQRILGDFEDRAIDILVGTQMITKGLDFDNVSTVGVLSADGMLNFPDFRAFERSFQLMAQVAGRSGRKNKRGKVIIQTYNPNHQIITQVIANDYMGMYKDQLLERKNFYYPPFHRLIRLTLKHRDMHHCSGAAAELAAAIHTVFGNRMLGPEFPLIPRLRNLYHKNILLKVEKESSIVQSKILLAEIIENFKQKKEFRSVRLVIDVDPY